MSKRIPIVPLAARQALAAQSRVQSPRAQTIPNKKRQASRLACRTNQKESN